MQVDIILVVGAGQMGSGIAQVAAQSGYSVYLYDIDSEALEKGKAAVIKNLDRQTEKGKLSLHEKEVALSRLNCVESLELANKAGFVIEAAVEDMNVKAKLFTEIDTIFPKETIFATNTSSLPITEIAAHTKRPEKFIGMHFMNPVPIMPLVEIISGQLTEDDVVEFTYETANNMGKTPVVVNDFPGFVSNRVLMPMINEAIFCVYEGIAEPEGVDQVMKLGMNHPMGPLALADLIGLDTCLYILEVLHKGYGDPKFRPCPLLKRYVNAGLLGKKSGRGFYTY